MEYIKEITLEVDKENFLNITAQQLDTARVLNFRLLNNGENFSLSNRQVRFLADKPDNTQIFNDCVIVDAEKGQCKLKLTNQVLAKEGIVKCQLKITEGADILKTAKFNIVVDSAINESNIESKDEFTALEKALAKADEYNSYYEETSGKLEEKYTTRLTEIDKKADTNTNKISSLENTSATKTEVEENLKLKASNTDVYLKNAIDNLLTNKRDKNTNISMADLGQDVKEALTGGSVATVGKDSVDTVNVKNNAITNIKIANGAVGRLKQVGSIAQILTKDSIEINIKEGLLKIKNAPYCFTDTTSAKFGKDNTNFTIDKTAVLSKAYCLHADMATLSIEFKELSKITNPYMILCYIVFSGNINNVSVCYCGNSKSIKVYDNLGAEIIEREHSASEEIFIYPTSDKRINIEKVADSTTDIKITVKSGTYLLSTNYAYSFTKDTEQVITVARNTYLSKLYFNFSTSKFEVGNFTNKTHVEPHINMIGWFILNNSGGNYWGANKDCIYLQDTNYLYKKGICNCLGDSLTYGLQGSGRLTNPYPSLLKDSCGFSLVNNYGISSSTIATNSSVSNWNEVRNPMVLRYGNMDANAKAITVLAGSNDYLTNVPLGTMNDTSTDTFYGALHTLYSGLIKKYPTIPILVITPPRARADKLQARTDNVTFKEWVNAIKEVANYYSLPILDLYNEFGINPDIEEQASLIPDGLHPSQVGANILARKIGKFINYRL